MGYQISQQVPFTTHVSIKINNKTPLSTRFHDAIRRRLVGLVVKYFQMQKGE